MTNSTSTTTLNITTDLTWIDLLKGMAIIGVFFDNWIFYYGIHFPPIWGPFVQVFFILSGFGLTLGYLKKRTTWDWKQWAWRRITKVVIPYLIVIMFSFILGILGLYLFPSIKLRFSWLSVLTYLTFTRNFYQPSWSWNWPMWFMPVIIGLYLSFPVLIHIIEKWGMGALLLISLFVTWGTLTVGVLTGLYHGHGSDLFSFWMIQFSLGIALAYIRTLQPQKLQHLLGVKAFFLGMSVFGFSWVLRTYVSVGKTYNDLFSSIGIFLILLNLGWIVRLRVPAIGQFLSNLGYRSYLMFLIHAPIIMCLIGPLLTPLIHNDPLIGLTCGAIYIIAIFFLCSFISGPMDKLTLGLYRLFFPLNQRDTVSVLQQQKEVLL